MYETLFVIVALLTWKPAKYTYQYFKGDETALDKLKIHFVAIANLILP
jgi:hypothetical protein